MKQPEYLRSTKALTPLLNTDAFYISTEKDPPSPLAGSFSCRQLPAARPLGVPYAQGRRPCVFCGLPSVDCGLRSFPSPVCDFVGDAQRASRFRIGVVSQTGPQGHHPHIRQCQPLVASISSRILYITGYMIGGSWFVKACHYTRMGCDKLSLAGRLNQVGPYAQGRRPCVFCGLPSADCGLRPALISIACM